jgi:hypothetical protein
VCAVQHPKILRKLGETDDRIFAVAAWREAPYFTEAERATLALTEAVTRLADRADPVPDEIWDEAARHYDVEALASLVLTRDREHQRLEPLSTSPPARWPARSGDSLRGQRHLRRGGRGDVLGRRGVGHRLVSVTARRTPALVDERARRHRHG